MRQSEYTERYNKGERRLEKKVGVARLALAQFGEHRITQRIYPTIIKTPANLIFGKKLIVKHTNGQ